MSATAQPGILPGIAEAPPRRNHELLHLPVLLRRLALYAGICTIIVVVCFPLFWMVVGSFKTRPELYQYPPSFLPATWTLANYAELLTQTGFLTYFGNSLIVAGGSTAISLVIGAMGAYSLARFRFRGLAAFAQLTLLAYMLPEVLLVIPLYVWAVKLRLADTLIALIIANTAFTVPLTLWFLRSYFAAIPVSLEESAMIDGNTRFQAFRRVTLPLALPGVISVGVFAFNHSWNEFLFALVFTSSESKKVLPVGFATWIGQDNIYSWGMLLAGAVLITLPVLLFYLLVQRHLVSGMSSGGAKGE